MSDLGGGKTEVGICIRMDHFGEALVCRTASWAAQMVANDYRR